MKLKHLFTLLLAVLLLASGREPAAPINDPAAPPSTPSPAITPAPQETAEVTEQPTGPYWAIGQLWADTTSPGYCPGYMPYESAAAPPALSWPVPGGALHEGRGFRQTHTGIDIDAELWTAVLAGASGRVVWAVETDFFGNDALVVAVSHGGGWLTVYAHLSAVLVDCWEWIDTRDVIGEVGMSGLSTFPHLHFDLRNGRYSYDPAVYLSGS